MTAGPGFAAGAFDEAFNKIALFVLLVVLILAGASGAFGWMIGFSDGLTKYIGIEHAECTKKEDRQFADTGFMFIPGTGEITTQHICVEWIVRR